MATNIETNTMSMMPLLDPETEFLASKDLKTGNEWELFKENVKPLKRGRNINLLNDSLKPHLKKSLLHRRRELIEAIDKYQGDDPLKPWIQCIKWVQESYPTGGDCSGLVVIYEQCVRAFWGSDRYKDDLRYLRVWLEYAENCADAEVIYGFLEANGIGQKHSLYYISYALYMEFKNKIRNANEIFNLGIAREAKPIKRLQASYKNFLTRSMSRPQASTEEPVDSRLPVRSFGTVLARGESRRQNTESSDPCRKKVKPDRGQSTAFSIYKDTNPSTIIPSHQPEFGKAEVKSWNSLGTRAERNKENTAIPSKWTSTKIPQRPGSRSVAAVASACIEVFVDEDCVETMPKENEGAPPSSSLQLRRGDSKDVKKETELLKENPLRNFPPNSLPR
ncbi:hypothetical protein GIB67_033757 [Kingdonia uniflora]|uniref:BUB1 N-terminal domain-containing protein n=1 Tax=Kingdonia uniflora TaxID=39325 RepID=A0A7J7P460_9MAGN|nr:hypothetical protein GIB67_033757 [Kingdonia uniflora]